MNGETKCQTAILPVDVRAIGNFQVEPADGDILDSLRVDLDLSSQDAANLRFAAAQLKNSDIPVAFPTETVYGLGADATRSEAVRGIYKAKQRPADNPLIVHFGSIQQLRSLLRNEGSGEGRIGGIDTMVAPYIDPIPKIYHPLIRRFWPGPLTIILANPPRSALAPEVTAGLNTFGARIPKHILALALIQQAGVPVAAPSANASTKPSPTAAEHVAYDLQGRVETILDGGPCDVGVESTVVDGLSHPPAVLRPGGISIEQLRSCPGWEDTRIGYKNLAEQGDIPRAPGMKYRHYSPAARVILYEVGAAAPSSAQLISYYREHKRVGVITTSRWSFSSSTGEFVRQDNAPKQPNGAGNKERTRGFAGLIADAARILPPSASLARNQIRHGDTDLELLEIPLGPDIAAIARGIFAALRELDRAEVDAIIVEGIDDDEGERAAAVMNRLRKAAEVPWP